MATDVNELIENLDGGVLKEKLSRMLSDVASSVVEHGTKGQVVITLDMEQIASSNQINVTHTLKYVRPKHKGKLSEDDKNTTPLHVNRGGTLSVFPESGDLFQQREEGAEQ